MNEAQRLAEEAKQLALAIFSHDSVRSDLRELNECIDRLATLHADQARDARIQALEEQIRDILTGIDQEEWQSEDGWWLTSTGAEFGAERLHLIAEAINALTQETQPAANNQGSGEACS